MWRSIIIALALICLVLLGWYAVRKYPGRVESALEARAQTALQAKVPGVIVEASQRDLVLKGAVADEAASRAAEALATDLSGVKSVINRIEIGGGGQPAPIPVPPPEPPIDPPAADAAVAEDDAGGPGPTADAGPSADAAPEPAEVAPSDTNAAAPEVADTAPAAPEVAAADTAPAAAPEVAVADPVPAAPVDPGGALNPAQCKAIIQDMIEGDKRITFKSNTGRLLPEGEDKVKAIYAVLQRCPTATGVIEGYHDDYGDPDRLKMLTRQRAYQVHKMLVDLGMDPERFKYAGLGYRNMRYGRTPDTRLLNQRVEFNITVE